MPGTRAQIACRLRACLLTHDPVAKACSVRALAEDVAAGATGSFGRATPPDRPGRPPKPELLPPTKVPRRGISADPRGRIALLHALAHIELTAIDLACDILIRLPDADLPDAFRTDWLRVAAEEAKHFLLLSDRLEALGAAYGDLPAHDGLWQAALDTADDILARLAIVPLVLEARGLDVTLPMIDRLRAAGDTESGDVLSIIHDEEIGHVAIGMRWFAHVCAARGQEPQAAWTGIVRDRFPGRVKPPFNQLARERAGFPASFWGAAAETQAEASEDAA